MKCYFCDKPERIIPEKRKLWNGKLFPQCLHCFKTLETGLKVAKERGIDVSANSIRGGDNMKVTKGATGGSNLKAVFVEEKKIANVKIADEGEYVTYQAKKEGEKDSTKLVVGISFDGQKDSDPHRWSMNNKSMNSLINKWGDDTAVWVGKSVEINLAGEGEYRHIVVDEIRTK